MEILEFRSSGLGSATARATEARDYTEPLTENSFFPDLPATGMSAGFPRHAAPATEVRSIVERRFMSMNEAHNRIRTALLASIDPDGE